MSKVKRIRLFGGPNGSGKSTLFQQIKDRFYVGPFINADNLEQDLMRSGLIDLKSFGLNSDAEAFSSFLQEEQVKSLIRKAEDIGLGIDLQLRENFIVDKSKLTHSYESAIVAMFIRAQLIKKGISFSFETVMSHSSKLEELDNVIHQDYKLYLYYVCTDNPEVNVSRVGNRVKKGGHGVSDDKIKSRYVNSLENLFGAMQRTYRSYLFDNSGEQMRLIAEVFQNEMIIRNEVIPSWFQQYVLPHYSYLSF